MSAMASEKLLHCQIHGVKISGRKPRIADFMPSKGGIKNGSEALAFAQAQVAALRSEKIERKKNNPNG